MDKTKQNFITAGILTLVAIGIVAAGVWIIAGITTEPKQEVRFSFDFANSLDKGAPVRVSGVKAGKVAKVRLLTAEELKASGYQAKRVEVTASISRDIFIPKDSTASITASGLLSEKYLEITPGTYDSGRATEADLMAGKDPVSLDQMLTDTQGAVKKLDESLVHINALTAQVGEDLPGIITGLDKLIGSADRLTVKADGLVVRTDGLIASNEEELKSLLENMERASVNLKYLSRMLAERPWKMLLPAFPNKVPDDKPEDTRKPGPSGSGSTSIPKR
ncbi:MlaD family protein [Kamptonema cortianum]|nr:MlaD family protein [Kamptonema cortianum]MDL5044540.1 MlaD family protein [Oscillatoria amoena NRMC-F 0135]